MHIVHIKEEYNSLSQAVRDSTGVAVLGFVFEVICFDNCAEEKSRDLIQIEVEHTVNYLLFWTSILPGLIPNYILLQS